MKVFMFCSVKPKETKKGFKKDDMVKNFLFFVVRYTDLFSHISSICSYILLQYVTKLFGFPLASCVEVHCA